MLRKFWNDENGATAIEYALIASLISIAIVSGAGQLGSALAESFQSAGQELADANASN